MVLIRLSKWLANSDLVDPFRVIRENQVECVLQRTVRHLESWVSDMLMDETASQEFNELLFCSIAWLNSLDKPVISPLEVAKIEVASDQ